MKFIARKTFNFGIERKAVNAVCNKKNEQHFKFFWIVCDEFAKNDFENHGECEKSESNIRKLLMKKEKVMTTLDKASFMCSGICYLSCHFPKKIYIECELLTLIPLRELKLINDNVKFVKFITFGKTGLHWSTLQNTSKVQIYKELPSWGGSESESGVDLKEKWEIISVEIISYKRWKYFVNLIVWNKNGQRKFSNNQ